MYEVSQSYFQKISLLQLLNYVTSVPWNTLWETLFCYINKTMLVPWAIYKKMYKIRVWSVG